MNARELRVWHWRAAMSARFSARDHGDLADIWEREYPGRRCAFHRHRERNDNRRADFHIGAVQVLNDHPDCAGTTAEQDDAIMPKPHSTRKKSKAAI